MATVFAAKDLDHNSLVAIKLLHQNLQHNQQSRRRFEMEVRAASRVRHEALVQVLDSGLHRGTPFIVMEMVEGVSVYDHVRSHGPLDAKSGLRLFGDAARGIGALHAADVVHRDLKPGNLLIAYGGAHGTLMKVADFGYARIKGTKITAQGTVVGTSSYMPPEQVLGEKIDARTDVYALGVSLFWALTGERPFEADRAAKTFAHQVFSTPRPPSCLVAELDTHVDRIVTKAMRKNPDARYQTMSQLADDIGAVLTQGRVRKPSTFQLERDSYSPVTEAGQHMADALARTLEAEPTKKSAQRTKRGS